MRKLMWFTVGFAAVCALCARIWDVSGLLWMAAGLAVVSLGLLVGVRRIRWIRKIAVVLLGAATGLAWFTGYQALYLGAARATDGQILSITAQCTDYAYATDYGRAVDAVTELEGKTYRIRLYFNGESELEPGDYVRGDFLLRLTAPGGAKDATHHQGKGIFLLGYQKGDVRLAKGETLSWNLYPAILRHKLINLVEESFPADTAGFAKALLLGDRSGLDYETNTAFKLTGISHIVAVSGLHVSILFGLVHNLGLRKRWLSSLLGIPVLVIFAAVAGFTPSVTRACIMQILMILAALINRDHDSPTELSVSLVVMLTVNPLVVTSTSFLLSGGCVMGILSFYDPIRIWLCQKMRGDQKRRISSLERKFAGFVAMTLSSMVLTTPLVASTFGAVSLVGLVTNLLTLWVVTFIFCGIVAVCLLGLVSAGAATFAASVIAWPIRYVLGVAGLLAKFPLAAVYTRSIYIVIWLVFVYLLLAVFLFSKKRRPRVLLCCGVIGLCLALGASWLEPLMDSCRMTVLDVGQGQSIILQSEGKAYLVDCGGSYDEDAADLAADTLMSQGIFRLDGIIVTHFDRDHAGGLPYLMTRMETDALFLPDVPDETGIGEQLKNLAAGSVIPVSDDLELSYGNTILTVFGPEVTNSGNESSLAVLFQAENCDILITGDRSGTGERLLLRRRDLPRLEILVAGHHGAKSSTSVELLEATRPGIVAISVGANSYGHPSDELLARLEEYGCLVYRTDLNGNLIFRR